MDVTKNKIKYIHGIFYKTTTLLKEKFKTNITKVIKKKKHNNHV
jgi:hypothetical protein